MRNKIRSLSSKGAAELKKFLRSPQRPEGTFNFHELQGFLFAVASSPETVAPSEWLPEISNEKDIVFGNESEAQLILNHVMALYNEVNSAVLERSNALPTGIVFAEEVAANFKSDSSISQWSRGFSAGHNWLEDVWEEHLFGELDEECGATLMVLSFFSSKRLAKSYYAEFAPKQRKRGDTSFEDYAKTMRSMFPGALASYANIGRTIFEAILEYNQENAKPATSTKIGRNEPCPCGSGKKYKKCCGGQIH